MAGFIAAIPVIAKVSSAVASVAAIAQTTYSLTRGKEKEEHYREDATRAAEEARKRQDEAAAKAAQEAAARQKAMEEEQARIKAEAEAEKLALEEEKAKLQGVQTGKVRTGRLSLLATEGDVWTSRPAVRRSGLLGASESTTQLKSLLGG